MLKILQYLAKFGKNAAIKKFGSTDVKLALTGRSKPVKAKPKPKPKPPKKRGVVSRSATESMFGRKRKGPTPKRSDSQAYRDGVKASQKKADEKLNPSLRNKDIAPRSIESRRLDVLRQIREAKGSGASPKMIERLQSRAQNLKDMKSDRADLTTMGGKFKDGGLSTKTKNNTSAEKFLELLKRNKLSPKSNKPKVKKMPFKIEPGRKKPRLTKLPYKIDGETKSFIKKLLGGMKSEYKAGGSVIDLRKSGMFTKTTNNLKTSPRPVGRNDAAEAKAVEGGNRESARVAREDPMYLRPKARKNKK